MKNLILRLCRENGVSGNGKNIKKIPRYIQNGVVQVKLKHGVVQMDNRTYHTLTGNTSIIWCSFLNIVKSIVREN